MISEWITVVFLNIIDQVSSRHGDAVFSVRKELNFIIRFSEYENR